MPNDVAFLADGFNLYHSIKEADRDLGLHGVGTKWLDLRKLCHAHLHTIGNGATLASVEYFSAFANHLQSSKPGIVQRHQTYVRALESTGVTTHIHAFKRKIVRCSACATSITRYEEKETDVALAVRIVELAISGRFRTICVISGDTDVAPGVRAAKRLNPNVDIRFLFPYDRYNADLEKLTGGSVTIARTQYQTHQFPQSIALPNGKKLYKPSNW